MLVCFAPSVRDPLRVYDILGGHMDAEILVQERRHQQYDKIRRNAVIL